MRPIKVNLIINSIRSKKDKSLGFNAETPELTSEEKVAFMDLQGINIEAILSPIDELVQDDLLVVDKDIEHKTQSQRIRSVLYLLYKQNNETTKSFNDYYIEKTEKFIEYLKSKLEE